MWCAPQLWVRRAGIVSFAGLCLLFCETSLRGAEPPSAAQLRELNVSSWRLSQIDRVIEQGLSRGDFPGAVVLVRYRGVDLWR